MTQTALAKAPWPAPKKPKEQQVKPRKKIDANFEDWAKREGINLRDIKLMERKNA